MSGNVRLKNVFFDRVLTVRVCLIVEQLLVKAPKSEVTTTSAERCKYGSRD